MAIDIEPILYTELATALRSVVEGVFVTGESVNAPPRFPCASLVERSNTTYTRTIDSSHEENHSSLMWQCDFYSNLKTGKKMQCKEMAKIVDKIMIAHNFRRTMLEPIENADPTVYRMTARYVVVISKDKFTYRA